MRLASQALAMEVEEVEQAVVPAMETRGASSEAVSVALSAHKVSSDANCSLAQGWHRQRKPTEAAGSSAVAAVVIETIKSKSALSVFVSLTHWFNRREDGSAKAKAGPSKRAPSPIKVDDESKAKGEITPAQSKGKVHAVLKKTGGKSEARKTWDVLVRCFNHLHSWLFQIWTKVKELEEIGRAHV